MPTKKGKRTIAFAVGLAAASVSQNVNASTSTYERSEKPFALMWTTSVPADKIGGAELIHSDEVKGFTNFIVAENFESTSSSAAGASEGADTTASF